MNEKLESLERNSIQFQSTTLLTKYLGKKLVEKPMTLKCSTVIQKWKKMATKHNMKEALRKTKPHLYGIPSRHIT